MSLDVQGLKNEPRASAVWAAGLLHALVRDEVAGRRTARLTEPRLATWQRFRGRLSAGDFFALLFEDAAVLHPVPFEGARLPENLRMSAVPEAVAQRWLDALPALAAPQEPAEYLLDQARLLGLPWRMARHELHVVRPHQKVLELPGTGGQLAHHLLLMQPELSLKANFTVATCSWQEATMAGIVALDRGAPDTDFIVQIDVQQLRDAEHPLRRRNFDFVLGLHPDKGGLFCVENQLEIWYSGAKILLV